MATYDLKGRLILSDLVNVISVSISVETLVARTGLEPSATAISVLKFLANGVAVAIGVTPINGVEVAVAVAVAVG